jgi:ketosteroid isomerase-like protein
MRSVAIQLAVLLLLSGQAFAASDSRAESEVWSLEDSYWQYLKASDLEHYKTLWHADFLGWPLSSPEPVRKDHITDWVTAHTAKGETLKSYTLQRLLSQQTGNCVTVTYRVQLLWVDKAGVDKPGALRVIHTWLREPDRKWLIISGMAAAPDAQGH